MKDGFGLPTKNFIGYAKVSHTSHVRDWNTIEFFDLLTFEGFDVIQYMNMSMQKLPGIKNFVCESYPYCF